MPGTVSDQLEDLHGLLRGHRQPLLRKLGLTSAEYAALAQLRDGVARACGEMASRIGVRHQTMQTTLDGVERKGLIERAPPVGPGYARRAWLSRRGSEVVEHCRSAFLELEHRMLARFDAELADTFVQCLEECAARLRWWTRPAAARARARSAGRRVKREDLASHEEACPICQMAKGVT